MKPINGYFQLDVRNDGTYLKIFAPKDGGQKANPNEISSYLERNKINCYNIKEINSAIVNGTNEVEIVKVSDTAILPSGETMLVNISRQYTN